VTRDHQRRSPLFIAALQGRQSGVDHRGQGQRRGCDDASLKPGLRESSPAAPGCRCRTTTYYPRWPGWATNAGAPKTSRPTCCGPPRACPITSTGCSGGN